MKKKCKKWCRLAVLDGVALIHPYLELPTPPQAAEETSWPFSALLCWCRREVSQTASALFTSPPVPAQGGFPRYRKLCVRVLVSALLCSGAILGVKIAFGGITYMESKEGKKEIKEGQMTLRWREYEGGSRKRWLTPAIGQFGEGSVHMDLE